LPQPLQTQQDLENLMLKEEKIERTQEADKIPILQCFASGQASHKFCSKIFFVFFKEMREKKI